MPRHECRGSEQTSVEAAQDFGPIFSAVAATVFLDSLGIYSVAPDTEAAMPFFAVIDKYWRHIIAAIVLVVVIACTAFFFSYAAYMKNEPNLAEANKTLLLIRQGSLKPSRSGLVMTPNHEVYVSRAANGLLTVLWPYDLAHDDNYFEGLLFSDKTLTTDKVTALAPTRYPTAHKPWMTHLTVDRTISDHWYHVQGEMYK